MAFPKARTMIKMSSKGRKSRNMRGILRPSGGRLLLGSRNDLNVVLILGYFWRIYNSFLTSAAINKTSHKISL